MLVLYARRYVLLKKTAMGQTLPHISKAFFLKFLFSKRILPFVIKLHFPTQKLETHILKAIAYTVCHSFITNKFCS